MTSAVAFATFPFYIVVYILAAGSVTLFLGTSVEPLYSGHPAAVN